MPHTLHDVAIIGLGPVGATLANLLAQRGLSVLVLEREQDVYSLPRAIQFDGEVMRVFQTIGIADELEPNLVVAARMVFVDDEGHVLIDWKRPTDVRPQGWNTSYRFHQPTLERALRRRLADHDNATVALSHEVTGIGRCAEGFTLEAIDRASGQTVTFAARFVVGADGARSTARRVLGTRMDDLRSHERWLVVDCLLNEDMPELGDDSIQYCNPERPATYVRGPHNRRRWELMLHADEDATELTSEQRIWELLSPWIKPHQAEIERPAVYTFHSVVAQGWGEDGIYLAGDACHQTPPFMGQGMCAGIRDASNLAWKLAEVAQGVADPSLLRSYESERSPHVRTFIETAVRLGSVISTTDPELARSRNAAMRENPEAFTTPQPRLGEGLWEGSAEAAGLISEQPWLADGRRMDDLVGYHWAILAMPELAVRASAAWGSESRRLVTVFPADSASATEWLTRTGARAVLLRPDRYVAAVATDEQGLDAFGELVGRDCEPL